MRALAAAPVSYGASLIAVTASFGVATFPQDGRTGDELMAAADRALYAAKAAGRNRVNIHSESFGVSLEPSRECRSTDHPKKLGTNPEIRSFR